MDKDLKKVLQTLGIEDGEYYINDEGRVKKRGILLDEDTGIYQTKNGEFKKEGILFDENTGLKQNERGEFKEEGILFDKDTGIYQDKDGNYRKKGILIDEKTGYYKDKQGNIKKESFFGSSSNVKTDSSSSKNYSPPEDDVSVIFFYMKWAFIIGAAIFVIVVAVFLAPLILLIWYLIKKREMQWIAILGMVSSAYLIYDLISGGFITSSMMKMQRTGEEKYLALGYFVVLVTTLGFFIDKYTSMKIPISNNGNFFEQKNIKERRPFIAGFSLLLLVIFSIFQFVSFSGNDSKNPYNNSNVSNTNNNNQEQTSNSTEKDISELAVISDSDGYTNLRQGKGTNFAIVQKIYTNEKFKVYPSNEKWWKVKLNNGNQGYIFHNRVNLINKDFYVINVTATQTETKALKEVKKLINLGYDAGHLWIPNYNSLSKTKMYSVYIGPFSTQDECVKQTEKYRRTNPNAYGTLVSQQNKRVEIRGQNKIKIIEPYHK